MIAGEASTARALSNVFSQRKAFLPQSRAHSSRVFFFSYSSLGLHSVITTHVTDYKDVLCDESAHISNQKLEIRLYRKIKLIIKHTGSIENVFFIVQIKSKKSYLQKC